MIENNPQRVCLPWGFLPVGQRVRAACACGFTTSPRVDSDRALQALLTEHGHTEPKCVLCDRNHLQGQSLRDWDAVRRRVEILPDGAGSFLVCRGMPRSCRDCADRKQLRLDSEVAEAFGLELPRPRLRAV
jgi:hypothetical protein